MKKIFILIVIFCALVSGLFLTYQLWPVSNFFVEKQIPDLSNQNKESISLYGDWQWISSTDTLGKTITPKDPSKFKLTLNPNGKLESTTDCNSLSGSFVKSEEVLSIGPLVATEMACEGQTLELDYSTQLAWVSSYSISNQTLTLVLIKDFGTMTFYRR